MSSVGRLIMAPNFQAVRARRADCFKIARTLRPKQRAAMIALGLRPFEEFQDAYDNTLAPMAWLIDGELAAVGGVAGSGISPYGFVWLGLAEQATAYPVAIVKEALRQFRDVLAVKRHVVTTLLPGDEAAWRFADFFGFDTATPVLYRNGLVVLRHRSVRRRRRRSRKN
jgi:hypothetical protein